MKVCAAVLVAIGLVFSTGCAPENAVGIGDSAPTAFSHELFDAVLQEHVGSHGLVDYAALRRDRARLDQYLDALARTDASSLPSREDRLAYWLNAYNAFTIAGVLDHYPVKSVQDVERFFKEQRYKAGGARYSLDDIENAVIRPTFREPRIHFVLVCAAKSCPRLWSRAIDPGTLEQRLEASAKKFINSPAGARVDRTKKELTLSALFKWYRTDFLGEADSLAGYVRRYLDDPPSDLAQYRVRFQAYDWSLNER
ncbi:MAG: DUF547 domain-containing protein [Armatimonadota bacterium]|nr:MAG: DUF547 domain-containing protein [Armatimonadota bacterium]